MAERPPEEGSGGDGGKNNKNRKGKGKKKVVPEYGKNRHGMLVGFNFVPKNLELFVIPVCKLVHGELSGTLNNIFKQIRILEFHPHDSGGSRTKNMDGPT
uniref:Uncharacterized protein n=1 Tax=Oryza punctata TaxID=4537 RepID=A0A0E0JGC0_ORYPU